MEEQKLTFYERIAYWLDSHITPLSLRPLFSKPLIERNELEGIIEGIRQDAERYERETGKQYRVPLA